MKRVLLFLALTVPVLAQPAITSGNGAPVAACIHRDRYIQLDGVLGKHIWTCINTAGTTGAAGVWTLNEYLEGLAISSRGSGNGAPVSICTGDAAYTQTDAAAGQNIWNCVSGTMVQQGGGGGGSSVPAGAILLISAGSCPATYTEATELDGVMLRGTLAANADVGTTGGADSITPTGTNGAPSFTGTLASLTHSGTAVSAHSGTAVANHVFTQPTIAWPAGVPTNANESSHTHGGPTISWPAGVPTNASGAFAEGAISWPAGVPTHSGTTIADHNSHTHTYTDVVNHVHIETINSATTGATGNGFPALLDASTSGGPTSLWMSTANPTGGVATGTTAGPGATITHTVSSQGTIAWPAGVPTIAAGSFTQPTISWPAGVPTNGATGGGSAHTHVVSWPAGVPANSGGTVDAHAVTQPGAHTVTQPDAHSYTPAGTVAAPVFTGASFDNRPAFLRVIFCKKS